MARPTRCPACGEVTGVRIVRGLPSVRDFEAEQVGEVFLGGCIVEPSQPDYRCGACGFEWVGIAGANS